MVFLSVSIDAPKLFHALTDDRQAATLTFATPKG